MALYEPKYTVVQKNDTFEIRKYDSYLVAQTKVVGEFDEVGKKAFRILFNYISGENKKQNQITMTVPVIQENISNNGEKIPMSVPVMRESDSSDSKSAYFNFVMPQDLTLETLPLPLDKRIEIKQIPSKEVAVIRYSGGWGEENYKENLIILQDALHDANIKTVGNAISARYNSPFSLSFMRRNEIMFEVKR